jgi:hypothetical protein
MTIVMAASTCDYHFYLSYEEIVGGENFTFITLFEH